MSLVLVVIAVLVVAGIVAAQNYRVVNQNYIAMQGLRAISLNPCGMRCHRRSSGEDYDLQHQAEELFESGNRRLPAKRIGDLSGEARSCLIEIFRGDEIQRELVFRCSDGQMKTLSVSVSDTGTTGEAVEQRTAVIRDLTETRRLEQAMQRKEKLSAMGELASGIAHEIRNPLNSDLHDCPAFRKGIRSQGSQASIKISLRCFGPRQTVSIRSYRIFLRFARPPSRCFDRFRLMNSSSRLSRFSEVRPRKKGVELKHTIDSKAPDSRSAAPDSGAFEHSSECSRCHSGRRLHLSDGKERKRPDSN